jgi:predicted ATP-dependent endonuclease of OLD family
MIKRIEIQNFKSIINTTVNITDNIFVLAGQNEAGKSSILEAIEAFENKKSSLENLNFEEQDNNNLIQKISITYESDGELFDSLTDEMKDLVANRYIEINFKETPLLDALKIKKIKEFTITRIFDLNKTDNDNDYIKTEVDKNTLSILKSSINFETIKIQDVGQKYINQNIPFIDFNEKIEDIINCLWRCAPIITLFNEFNDILPDSILINDLESKNKTTKGINAVIKIQTLLKEDFIKLSKKTNAQKRSSVDNASKSVSATLQNDWKQKIDNQSEIKILFDLQNNTSGQPIVFFYLESKEGVLLEPRRRSKGMIWFLSLWLELKSNENNRNMVLLFDEPGLHLHVKANNDMLNVFKRLKEKGHQIIYSTHLPSLIETDKLNNIGLVLNTHDKGTIVEGLTTSKLDTSNKKDALQPISEAMGLLPLKEFSILTEKNVLLEGLSDFWYFSAMVKILNKKIDYKFVPSIGIKASKIFPLISFCIGYGLDWLLIMDGGENPKNTKKELKELIFNNDEESTNHKIKLLDFNEIEDMFSPSDFLLVDEKFNVKANKLPSELIGSSRKIIFAKEFFKKVDNKMITKSKLDKQTIINFEIVFNFIEKSFEYKE